MVRGAVTAGEKNWLHMNALSYDAANDRILVSIFSSNEVIVLDRSLSTEQTKGHVGGKHGKVASMRGTSLCSCSSFIDSMVACPFSWELFCI